jgi:transposase
MSIFAGLDVSDKTTHICVVDDAGELVWRGACATDPNEIAKTLSRRAPGVVRVVLETGPLSVFLYHGLVERGVPVTCICARHAKGVLSTRVNKSDPHDAEGLAQLARTGWFKSVRIKQEATHLDRAQLKIREQLTKSHRAMANQLRGLLKLFGLRLGKVTTPGKRAERLAALFAQKPELEAIMLPLIESLEALEVQIRRSTKLLAAGAAADPVAARLMTVPGVGPITALTFKSSIEDPDRFDRGEDAGAFAGLVPRRSQSGERDYKGRISKAGDPMLRSALYEAANNLLVRVKRPSALQTWGKAIAQAKGPKRARVAVARKLAVLLHRLWLSETEFCWN